MAPAVKVGAWGSRRDFRKLTITLPPDVYDAIIQESARRKSAGDPNHLLSAIAREWFADRLPLLPIEKRELELYRRTMDGCDWCTVRLLSEIVTTVGESNAQVIAELLLDMAQRGWILLERRNLETGRYVSAQDADSVLCETEGEIRLKITIPGRRRKEALETKELRTARGKGAELADQR